MFEVTHDGIGKELLQIVGLGSCAGRGIIVVRGAMRAMACVSTREERPVPR